MFLESKKFCGRCRNVSASRHVLRAGTRPITTDYRWNGYGRIIDIGGAYVSVPLPLCII